MTGTLMQSLALALALVIVLTPINEKKHLIHTTPRFIERIREKWSRCSTAVQGGVVVRIEPQLQGLRITHPLMLGAALGGEE